MNLSCRRPTIGNTNTNVVYFLVRCSSPSPIKIFLYACQLFQAIALVDKDRSVENYIRVSQASGALCG